MSQKVIKTSSATRRFEHQFKKLLPKIQIQFWKRLALFQDDPAHPQLHDHQLKGKLTGRRAFSVSGNIRAIYRFLGAESIKLLDIGNHDEVYR